MFPESAVRRSCSSMNVGARSTESRVSFSASLCKAARVLPGTASSLLRPVRHVLLPLLQCLLLLPQTGYCHESLQPHLANECWANAGTRIKDGTNPKAVVILHMVIDGLLGSPKGRARRYAGTTHTITSGSRLLHLLSHVDGRFLRHQAPVGIAGGHTPAPEALVRQMQGKRAQCSLRDVKSS